MTPRIEDLKELCHQPNRLAIMTELCAVVGGLSFSELQQRVQLTDGNLSRHLKVLEEAGGLKLKKTFVAAKPHTQIEVLKAGREAFLTYLDELERILEQAKRARKPVAAAKLPGGLLKGIRAG